MIHPVKQLVIIEDHEVRDIFKNVPFMEIGNENTIKSPDYYFGENMEEAAEAQKGVITSYINPVISGFRIEAELYYDKKYTFLRRNNAVPMFSDITFVIQGVDVHTTFISSALAFLYGYLIISTWNTYGNLKQISKHINQCQLYNNQNIFLQIHSTLLGLQRVTTKNVIKMRADEVFLNLIPFILKMYDSPHKIITTNIFIRKTAHFPYHCSDYILGGSKNNIEDMFKNANLLIHNREHTKLPKLFNFHCWVPEQILTVGYLLSHYPLYYILEYDCATLMNLHFDSIDLHSLNLFQVVFTKWDYDENGVLGSKKVIITPLNFHEHQNYIIDSYSYKSLLNL